LTGLHLSASGFRLFFVYINREAKQPIWISGRQLFLLSGVPDRLSFPLGWRPFFLAWPLSWPGGYPSRRREYLEETQLLVIGLYLFFQSFLVGFHFSYHFDHDGYQTFEIRRNYQSCGLKSDGAQFTTSNISIQLINHSNPTSDTSYQAIE
jgi:hypothetical protein